MDELKDLRNRVKDAKRAYKEAGRVYQEARAKVQSVLESAEAKALHKFNEDIAPFLRTYSIATAIAFKKAQDDSSADTLGTLEIEAYKKLLQAKKELQEATK